MKTSIATRKQGQLRFGEPGRLEFREMQTSALSCLAAFLRTHGIPIHIDDLPDIAPISSSGLSTRLFEFVVRRIRIEMTDIDVDRLADHVFDKPILLRRKSGYSMLVLDMLPYTLKVALPGHSQPVCTLRRDSDIFDELVSVNALQLLAPGPAFRRRLRQSRLWLLPDFKNRPAQYIRWR